MILTLMYLGQSTIAHRPDDHTKVPPIVSPKTIPNPSGHPSLDSIPSPTFWDRNDTCTQDVDPNPHCAHAIDYR